MRLSLAVKAGGTIIADTNDLFQYCSQHLTLPLGNEHLHSRRIILFVKRGTIPRDRPDWVNDSVKGIQGSLKLHSVRSLMSTIISAQDRSCFCDIHVCLGTTLEPCRNIGLCGERKTHNLLKLKVPRRPPQRNGRGKFIV